MGPGPGHLNWSYPLVNKHSNGKPPVPIGNIASKGLFSIAMLVYRFFSLSEGQPWWAAPSAPQEWVA